MKSARSLPVHLLLLLYILISGTYQVVAAVSLVVGFFDLRHQVHQPFEVALAMQLSSWIVGSAIPSSSISSSYFSSRT
jgi:hypothetical protein